MFSDATLSYVYDDPPISSDTSGDTLASTLRHGYEIYRPEASAAPEENALSMQCMVSVMIPMSVTVLSGQFQSKN